MPTSRSTCPRSESPFGGDLVFKYPYMFVAGILTLLLFAAQVSAKLLETTELERRIEALEAFNHPRKGTAA